MDEILLWGLRIAGAGQILLASLHAVGQRGLGWDADLARLRPLNAQIFLSLFRYIMLINLCMGLLGLVAPRLLTDGSTLALLVAGFIGCYWSGRLGLQLFHYRWSEAPGFIGSRAARAALACGFAGFAAAHWLAVARNIGAL